MTARVMGAGNVPVLRVEDDGRIIRGIALPFGETAIVPGPKNTLALEVMDEKSVAKIPDNLPLLVSHDRNRPPVGVVRSAAVTAKGVMVEAELIGSDDELTGWRRRIREGLNAGLSVGFTRDRHRDVHKKPDRVGGLPLVIPRGIAVHEVSLVHWPAYPSAGVVSLSVRSAVDQDRHEKSERIIAKVNMDQAMRRGRKILEEKRAGKT